MKKSYIQYIAELKNIYGEELIQNALSEMTAKHDANWDLFVSGEFDVLEPYLP
jgi:hypothetical protein